MESAPRELLAAAPAGGRRAKLDAGRADTAFQVGDRDRVLLRTRERLDAADIGSRVAPAARWDGPFVVTGPPARAQMPTPRLAPRLRLAGTVTVRPWEPMPGHRQPARGQWGLRAWQPGTERLGSDRDRLTVAIMIIGPGSP